MGSPLLLPSPAAAALAFLLEPFFLALTVALPFPFLGLPIACAGCRVSRLPEVVWVVQVDAGYYLLMAKILLEMALPEFVTISRCCASLMYLVEKQQGVSADQIDLVHFGVPRR
jgi:hypothetical protein